MTINKIRILGLCEFLRILITSVFCAGDRDRVNDAGYVTSRSRNSLHMRRTDAVVAAKVDENDVKNVGGHQKEKVLPKCEDVIFFWEF